VIFEVIGTPQLDDLPHLDENTAQLLSNLPTRSPQVRYNKQQALGCSAV
jgi:hypothetical protein